MPGSDKESSAGGEVNWDEETDVPASPASNVEPTVASALPKEQILSYTLLHIYRSRARKILDSINECVSHFSPSRIFSRHFLFYQSFRYSQRIPYLTPAQFRNWVQCIKEEINGEMGKIRTVAEIYTTMMKEREELQEAIERATNQRGYLTLPNELWFCILEYDVCSEGHPYDRFARLIELSAVCKRFRDILHSSPALWTLIDPSFHYEVMGLCLQRSRNAPLELHCEFENDPNHYEQDMFFNMCLPHSHRWRGLVLNCSWLTEEECTRFMGLLEGAEFPKLESLTLFTPTTGTVMDDIDECIRPYRSWVIPSLKTMSTVNIFPSPIQSFQLREFNLTIDAFELIQPFDMSRFMAFLESQPTLESITISCKWLPWDIALFLTSPIRLPLVRSFKLGLNVDIVDEMLAMSWDVTYFDGGMTYLSPLMNRLELPAIEALTIDHILTHVDEAVEPELDENFNISKFLPLNEVFSSLTSLRLWIFQCQPKPMKLSTLGEIFRKAPNLRYLSLRVPEIEMHKCGDLDLKAVAPRVPPLKVLQLEKCFFIDLRTLHHVLSYLSEGDSWDGFQDLQILSCPLLEGWNERLESILPSEKVTRHRYKISNELAGWETPSW